LTQTSKEIANWLTHKLFDTDPKYLVREEGTFYLSEVLYCASKVYFGVKAHTVSPPNAPMIRGKLLHEQLPKWLATHPDYQGATYEDRVPIYENEDFVIRGRADIVISHGDIVDEWKFGEKDVSGWDMGIASYLAQASEYGLKLNKKEARLYYVNLRKFTVWDWTIIPQEDIHNRIVDKAKKIFDSISNNKVPDYDSPIFKNECNDCMFSSFCPNFLGERTQAEKEHLRTVFAVDVEKHLEQLRIRSQALNGTVQVAVGQSASRGNVISSIFPIELYAKEAGYN